MRIIKLRMENWSRYEDVTLDMDYPTVALLGSVGSGKTSVMQAVEALFTGTVRGADAMESFILSTGKESDPKWARITAEFRHNNKVGTITRSYGSKSEKKLVWEGQTYTKVADIDLILSGIIMDKGAFSKIVCIKQGELNHLLFGLESERRDLLIPVLGCGHVGDVRRILQKYSGVLQESIVDLSPAIHEARVTLSEQERNLGDLRSRTVSITPQTGAIEPLEVSIRVSVDMVTKSADLRAYNAQLMKSQEALGNLENFKYKESRAEVVELEKRVGDLQAESVEVNKLEQAKGHQATHSAYSKVLEDWKRHLDSVNYSREKEDALRDKIAAVGWTNSTLTKLRELQTEIASIPEDLQNRLSEFEERLEKVKEVGVKVRHDLDHADKSLNMLKEQDAAGGGTCMVCGSAFDAEHRAAEMKRLAGVTADLKVQLESSRADYASTEAQLKQVKVEQERKNTLCNELADLVKQLQERNGEVPTELVDTETLKAEHQVEVAAGLQKAEAARQLASIEGTLKGIPEEYLKVDVSPLLLRNSEIVRAELGTAQGKLEELRATLRQVDAARDSNQEMAAKVTNLTAAIEALQQESRTLRTTLMEDFSITLSSDIEEQRTKLEELKGEIREVNDLKAKVEHQSDVVKRAEEALNGLLVRQEQDAEKVNLKKRLELLADNFAPGKAPMRYVSYMFNRLTQRVQKHLSALESNFTVVPDEEKNMAFRFLRLDDSNNVTFSQSKLSGGQRVCLSIAFLLAVQEVIIPDVNFLVLDEPSLHLDQDTKVQLGELLSNLSRKMDPYNDQLLICDHAVELTTAADKMIDVNSL